MNDPRWEYIENESDKRQRIEYRRPKASEDGQKSGPRPADHHFFFFFL
jgi:hypothetical protein